MIRPLDKMVKAKRKAYEVITLTPGGPTQKWIKTDLWEEKSRVLVKEEWVTWTVE